MTETLLVIAIALQVYLIVTHWQLKRAQKELDARQKQVMANCERTIKGQEEVRASQEKIRDMVNKRERDQ